MSEQVKEPCGVLAVYKPKGITSHDVVGKLRRLYHTRRVGHTGTLDPMATGVLVILIGRAAKAAEYLTVKDKTYRALLKLGLTTDTEDITGQVLTQSDRIPSYGEVMDAAAALKGDIWQVPPMYSALKVNGQKLVDLARRGVEIERKARPVTVHSIHVTPAGENEYALEVTCSAGTYIRTLCADIGKKLDCGGVMAALERTSTGEFSLEDCHTLEALEQMTDEERVALLHPVERLFDHLPALPLPAFYEKLCRSGCEIYQQKIKSDLPLGSRARLCTAEGRFFALGEVREYEAGTAVKAIKQFDLE